MQLSQLIEKLAKSLPKVPQRRIACLAMLICDQDPEMRCLRHDEEFERMLSDIQLKMKIIDDQHAAVASELDDLASAQPCAFEPKHVWTLIRAIKVQSQFVDMLTGAGTLSNCSSISR